jgi:hypothetical protein
MMAENAGLNGLRKNSRLPVTTPGSSAPAPPESGGEPEKKLPSSDEEGCPSVDGRGGVEQASVVFPQPAKLDLTWETKI